VDNYISIPPLGNGFWNPYSRSGKSQIFCESINFRSISINNIRLYSNLDIKISKVLKRDRKGEFGRVLMAKIRIFDFDQFRFQS
jgi:hypothetical protein